jgi:hypothetical protein
MVESAIVGPGLQPDNWLLEQCVLCWDECRVGGDERAVIGHDDCLGLDGAPYAYRSVTAAGPSPSVRRRGPSRQVHHRRSVAAGHRDRSATVGPSPRVIATVHHRRSVAAGHRDRSTTVGPSRRVIATSPHRSLVAGGPSPTGGHRCSPIGAAPSLRAKPPGGAPIRRQPCIRGPTGAGSIGSDARDAALPAGLTPGEVSLLSRRCIRCRKPSWSDGRA